MEKADLIQDKQLIFVKTMLEKTNENNLKGFFKALPSSDGMCLRVLAIWDWATKKTPIYKYQLITAVRKYI